MIKVLICPLSSDQQRVREHLHHYQLHRHYPPHQPCPRLAMNVLHQIIVFIGIHPEL